MKLLCTIVRSASVLGAALLLQVLFVVATSGACPETKTMLVECDTEEFDETCDGANKDECEADRKIDETFNQPLEDDDNSPEQTKTQVQQAEEDKVTCYNYYACEWKLIGQKCEPDDEKKGHKVNPLKTIDC